MINKAKSELDVIYNFYKDSKKQAKYLIDGVNVRLKELILEIANENDFKVLEMEILPNHVHLLIDCNPKFGINECIKKIKGTTASILRKEFPFLKSRIPTLWTRSAFISTCGDVSLEIIKQYIENQKNV